MAWTRGVAARAGMERAKLSAKTAPAAREKRRKWRIGDSYSGQGNRKF